MRDIHERLTQAGIAAKLEKDRGSLVVYLNIKNPSKC